MEDHSSRIVVLDGSDLHDLLFASPQPQKPPPLEEVKCPRCGCQFSMQRSIRLRHTPTPEVCNDCLETPRGIGHDILRSIELRVGPELEARIGIAHRTAVTDFESLPVHKTEDDFLSQLVQVGDIVRIQGDIHEDNRYEVKKIKGEKATIEIIHPSEYHIKVDTSDLEKCDTTRAEEQAAWSKQHGYSGI